MILGLFTELTTPGGVQRVGRHVALVLSSTGFLLLYLFIAERNLAANIRATAESIAINSTSALVFMDKTAASAPTSLRPPQRTRIGLPAVYF